MYPVYVYPVFVSLPLWAGMYQSVWLCFFLWVTECVWMFWSILAVAIRNRVYLSVWVSFQVFPSVLEGLFPQVCLVYQGILLFLTVFGCIRVSGCCFCWAPTCFE